MKTLKYFFSALLLAGAVGMVSCKDDDKPKVEIELDFPLVPKEAGKITIFAKFEGNLCDSVTLAGSHYLKVDSVNADWAIDSIAAMGLFESAGVIDGKDWGKEGWWKITVNLTPTSKVLYGDNKEFECVLGAKPVQLKGGAFPEDWSSQVGYTGESDVVVKGGDVVVTAGYSKECNIYFTTNATAAIIFKRWKKDPCVPTPKHNYTFTVTVPAATPAEAVVYIMGGMNSWGGTAMTKGADGKFRATFNDLEEGTEYKYTLNGDWATEELQAIQGEDDCAKGVANRETDEDPNINDEVGNWKGVTADPC